MLNQPITRGAHWHVTAQTDEASAESIFDDHGTALREAHTLMLEALPVGGGVSRTANAEGVEWSVRDQYGQNVSTVRVGPACHASHVSVAAAA